MTVYYQFNILPKKSTVHHEMAWFTNYQNNARMTSARKQTLFRSHCSAWSGNVQSCVRYVCSIQMCVVCSLIQVTHSRGQDLNEKFYWKLLLWLTCQREMASQGTHTASVVAHDGLTSKIGLLLAMTVGSCHLKNFLSVVNIEKEFYDFKDSYFRLETFSSTMPMSRSHDQRGDSQL